MAEYYIGLMSGTSLDGVDAALCEIGPSECALVTAITHRFPADLRQEILETIEGQRIQGKSAPEQIGRIDRRLGLLFADAVSALMKRTVLDKGAVTAVGSHGQTLWHAPRGLHPFTMQLGDPNIIAAKTGMRVAADFRRMDLAYGGQGAPLAPAFHRFAFKALTGRTGVLNIGGMANLTLLDECLGFDTGPGNVLMDGWVQRHLRRSYDTRGAWAARGKVHGELLEFLLREPFFAEAPPKSTGRELFNAAWLNSRLQRFPGVAAADVQATLLELTVASIAEWVQRFRLERLLVCGGGVKNLYLMQRLGQSLRGIEVAPSDTYGVNGDYMEAMAFAWLAYMRVHRQKVVLSLVTGAAQDSILGGLYE